MPKTYHDVYIDVRKRLREQGIGAYSLEARILVAAAAEKSREAYLRDSRLYVNKAFEDKVDGLLARRLAGEPLAYITGSWEFYGLPCAVSREVLIPRIDTEVVADVAIEFAGAVPNGARVLDLCAGSGCIGIAVAANVPQARVVLADLDEPVLRVCRSNVARNKLTRRITCVRADALGPPPPALGAFDLLVSNPPYIPTGELAWLEPSVRDFEPRRALDGGADGLDFYRHITAGWKGLLRPGGALIYECGEGQAEQVEAILRANGFDEIGTARDTLGIVRVVLGKRKEEAYG